LPLWGSQALDAVEALGPLSHAEQERLAAVLPKLQSSYFVRSMLEHLGARLTGGDHRAFLELLVDAYRKIPDRDARTALAFWVRSDGFRQGVSAVEFFCAAFDSADSRDRLTLQSVLMDRDRGAKCVVERLGEK
jgi:cysteine synthase